MTNEQREAMELAKEFTKMDFSNPIGWTGYYDTELKELSQAIDTVLSMLKRKDKEIEHLKENIDYKTLCDFLISSVSDEEEPIWTEKHIEELLDNFEVRWKDAHK